MSGHGAVFKEALFEVFQVYSIECPPVVLWGFSPSLFFVSLYLQSVAGVFSQRTAALLPLTCQLQMDARKPLIIQESHCYLSCGHEGFLLHTAVTVKGVEALYLHVFIYNLSIYLTGRYWSTYLPTYLPANPATYLHGYLPTYFSTCQPSYRPTYPPACLPACQPNYILACLSLSLPTLSINPPVYRPSVYTTSISTC